MMKKIAFFLFFLCTLPMSSAQIDFTGKTAIELWHFIQESPKKLAQSMNNVKSRLVSPMALSNSESQKSKNTTELLFLFENLRDEYSYVWDFFRSERPFATPEKDGGSSAEKDCSSPSSQDESDCRDYSSRSPRDLEKSHNARRRLSFESSTSTVSGSSGEDGARKGKSWFSSALRLARITACCLSVTACCTWLFLQVRKPLAKPSRILFNYFFPLKRL